VTVWLKRPATSAPFSHSRPRVWQYPDLGRIKYALPGWPGQCGVLKALFFGESSFLMPGGEAARHQQPAFRQLAVALGMHLFSIQSFFHPPSAWISPLLEGWPY